jgi:hypothetical protein
LGSAGAGVSTQGTGAFALTKGHSMFSNRVIKDRVTVDIDAEFVVFLIGMRVNKWWKVHRWFPIAVRMLRMIGEQKRDPACGLLSGQYGTVGNPIIYLQYWRSYEALEQYAHDAGKKHRSAWTEFHRSIATNGDVGIWHETYRIAPAHYECVYINMPPFGLGRTAPLIPARQGRLTSRARMEQRRRSRSVSTDEADIPLP